jgi:hypothetical protein
VITIDVEEADDARREQRRSAMREPYRTLLGHLRHESGHYYWDRLVLPSAYWLERFRALFGDERQDYAAALRTYYSNGAPPDWSLRHISAYASAHPWEDWAETWAHYLHLIDTLDTARSFGLDGSTVELNYERFQVSHLDCEEDGQAEAFVALINGWMELTGGERTVPQHGRGRLLSFCAVVAVIAETPSGHRITHAQRQGVTA